MATVADGVNVAENLAAACIWAGKADRWLIQVIAPAPSSPLGAEYRDYENASEAAQIIYNAENAGKISHACADRALHYLKEATEHFTL